MKFLFFILLSIFFGIESQAKDLGSFGHEFAIAEKDLLQEIEGKLKHYQDNNELEKFNQSYREQVKKQIQRPSRVSGIINAEKNRTRTFDPAVELEEDILVPKDPNEKEIEKIEYHVLYPAGTKINPLDHMEFDEPLIFIDGDIEEQREFAHQYQDNNPLARIILINGVPGFRESEEKEYYYYFDQWGAYSSLFNITKIPSVVYQRRGEKLLTIEEVRVG